MNKVVELYTKLANADADEVLELARDFIVDGLGMRQRQVLDYAATVPEFTSLDVANTFGIKLNQAGNILMSLRERRLLNYERRDGQVGYTYFLDKAGS